MTQLPLGARRSEAATGSVEEIDGRAVATFTLRGGKHVGAIGPPEGQTITQTIRTAIDTGVPVVGTVASSGADVVEGVRATIAAYAQALDDSRTEDIVATFCPDGSTPRSSTGWPPSLSRQRPTASKRSSAKPRPSMRAWHTAQLSLLRCAAICARRLAALSTTAPAGKLSLPGGGAGGGASRRLSRIHLPRLTGEVRVGFEVSARMLAWPSRPWRRGSPTGTRCSSSSKSPASP